MFLVLYCWAVSVCCSCEMRELRLAQSLCALLAVDELVNSFFFFVHVCWGGWHADEQHFHLVCGEGLLWPSASWLLGCSTVAVVRCVFVLPLIRAMLQATRLLDSHSSLGGIGMDTLIERYFVLLWADGAICAGQGGSDRSCGTVIGSGLCVLDLVIFSHMHMHHVVLLCLLVFRISWSMMLGVSAFGSSLLHSWG